MHSLDAGRAAARALHRVRWALHAHLVETKLYALRYAIKANFDPNQPRVPAGNPDGGQWTDAGGGGNGAAPASDLREGQTHRVERLLHLAGAFSDSDKGLTVQSFASANCLGSINRMLPGQFLDVPIAEVIAAAKGGDIAARRCLKLLGDSRFRK